MSRFAIAFLFCLGILVPTAFAHDGEWGSDATPLDIDWIGNSQILDLEHIDADPFKGWATLNVRNTGNINWGDFHLKIGGQAIESVDFVDSASFQPELWVKVGSDWVQYTDLTWNINNNAVGAELDMFFYGSPIVNSEKARIKVYTDNTATQRQSFHVTAYATPIPEPTTIALLGLGAISILRRRVK